MSYSHITVQGAREHNLKNITVKIPKESLTVITGLSGSGKSTLAFDTIYAEGQRRYVESLSAYARQFLGIMQKPDVDSIEGLSPAISIEQKTTSKNPRSTVGTVTEIYDYLRLLFARIGRPHCPICNKPIIPQTTQMIVDTINEFETGTKILILAPVIRDMKGTHEGVFEKFLKEGFTKAHIDGEIFELQQPPKLGRYQKHIISIVVDRLKISQDEDFISRLTQSIDTACQFGNDMVLIQKIIDSKNTEDFLFNKKGGCPDHPHIQFEELQPRMFSFNSPFGACPDCHGLGVKKELDPNKLINYSNSLAQGCVKTYRSHVDSWRKNQLITVAKYHNIDIFKPFKDLSKNHHDILLYGDSKTDSGRDYGSNYWGKDAFEGIIPQHQRLYQTTESDKRREEYEKYMRDTHCSTCDGKRLKPQSLSVYIKNKNIIDITDMSIRDVRLFFTTLKFTKKETHIAKQILKEIQERVSFLYNVGLGYLTLSRSAGTLSGGEAQRIRLATQIGANLTGVLYVLDEPSIGLHQRDNDKLIQTLQKLRDLGNTLIVVEHDEDTMNAADYIIDIGPGAGVHGGEIVFSGKPSDILLCEKSLTGKYLSKKEIISLPKKRRTFSEHITIKNATEHNLQNITVDIPLGVLTVITGVSGSGKSTLINETLAKALQNFVNKSSHTVGKHDSITGIEKIDKIVVIDQSPIGRTPRSNPATYTNVFTDIRELFAKTKLAKERGYTPGRFSFNVAGGRCDTCNGDGVLKIEMNFLPDVYVPCEVCKGKRYNAETLDVNYKQKNISDVLDMTVEEAAKFFENIPRIQQKLQTLNDVGLGYIKLGQSATTLSGGEAQRIKLTSELSKRATGNTIYILDEPTTGLHFDDVKKLLDVLNRLVKKGNTVLVIEHNLDVIKSGDWIIDMGPEGGSGGGKVIAQGTPEKIVAEKDSFTGQYLKKVL